jgi:DNA polymerase V
MGVYLRYVAPEDIFAYSVDEVFMDVTAYLSRYGHSAREMARVILRDVLATTGVTATVGIGTNMYLCKIAMDIVAKHAAPDEFGARIAELDEQGYREQLWGHRPLTDFWRVGRGYASRLERCGLYTMGDIARCSLGRPGDAYNEELLYRMFGVNAGLLIDHAWGWEPCTIEDVKGYRPESRSRTSGQVLSNPCDAATGRLILREMADGLSMALVKEGVTAERVTVTIGYDVENIADPVRRAAYRGKVTIDWYGRPVPKHTGGTAVLPERTSSTRAIAEAAVALFDRTTDPALLIRRLNVTAEGLRPEGGEDAAAGQMDLFSMAGEAAEAEARAAARERERRQQEAVLRIRDKYGKNALVKGMNLREGATAMERNRQIGGHRA